MKILHVIDQFGLEYGGSSEACFQMAKALAKRRHKVNVYAYRAGVKYEGMPDSVVVSDEWPSQKPDFVHIHNYRNFANIFGWRYAMKNRIPYVFQAHGSVATFFQKGLLKRAFDLAVGGRILIDAYKVVAVSNNEVKQYRDMGIPYDKVVLVPNGIDLSQYEHLPERGIFRKRYGIGDSKKLVLYLGRLHWMKGLDLLISSFVRVISSAKLAIVGQDDGYFSMCRRLVSRLGIDGRVIFTGGLYGREKLEAYVDADVCVSLSSYEIFGITVLEASACGTPVVVADNYGIVDWMPSVFAVPRDTDVVSGALNRILTNRTFAMRMSEQGKEAVSQFDWNKVAERLETLVYI